MLAPAVLGVFTSLEWQTQKEIAAEQRWESELRARDPQQYEIFVRERNEARRKAKIAELLAELKTVPATDVNRIHTLYLNLTALDPNNQEYKMKKEVVAKQAAQAACASIVRFRVARGEHPSLAFDVDADEECRLQVLAAIIKGHGHNCPTILSADRWGQDVYGTVTRVRCSSGMLRVTERPDKAGYLVSSWID
jgi:hypothetical protein